MRLKVLLPDRTAVDREVDKVVAESVHGSFCIEPRHIDYAAPIVAGILSHTREGDERFLGTSDGVLVKAGDEVLVSVRDAVTGAGLGEIRDAVRQRRERMTEEQDRTEVVARKLESRLLRRFAELHEDEEGGAW